MPRQFVRNDEIVLNISFEATSQLQMGNEWIEFNARFSGKSHKIEVPVANVLAIYARENGQGMAFPVESATRAAPDSRRRRRRPRSSELDRAEIDGGSGSGSAASAASARAEADESARA